MVSVPTEDDHASCVCLWQHGADPVFRSWSCFSGHLQLPRPHRRFGDSSRVPHAASGRRSSRALMSCVPAGSGASWSGSASCTPTTASHFLRRCGDRVSKVVASPVAARVAQGAFEAASHAPGRGVVLARFSALEFVSGLIDPRSRASAWSCPCSLSAHSSGHGPARTSRRPCAISLCDAAAIRNGSRHSTAARCV